jgi:hypothetical protein
MRAGFPHSSRFLAFTGVAPRRPWYRSAEAVAVWSASALIALAGIVGCSNSKPADSPTGASAANGASEPSDDLPELTPVPAPENIVGIASLRTPAQTLDTAMAWTGLGLDFRMLLGSGAGAAILPVLDLEAPLDAVVTIDPKVKNRPRLFVAAAIGLTSRQAALEAFESLQYPVEFVEPGIHSVRPNEETVCFVAPALGKAKARLVCGHDRESVELLAPYLTRGNPSEGAGDADLHVELRAEAPWRLFGDKAQLLELSVPMLLGEVSSGNPEFDAALRDGATALVDEIILSLGELRDLRLDAWFRSDSSAPDKNELEIDLNVAFNAARSWVARSLEGAESRASVAPDTFWKLPADSTQAAYYAVSNPSSFEGPVMLLERLFESGLGHLGASAPLRRSWPAAFKQAMEVKGPVVSSRGSIPKEALPATLDAREELRQSFGYTLVGVDDPESRFGAWLDRTLELYEDGALRKSLATKYGLDPTKLPKARTKKGHARLAQAKTIEIALPAALFAEALADKGIDPARLSPIPISIVSCRDGKYTWIGVSSYGAVLEQKLANVLTAAAPDGSLATRVGLDRLKQEPAKASGFQTLAGLASGPSFAGKGVDSVLAGLAQNVIPIVARARGFGPKDQNPGPSGSVQLHVPAQLFKDTALAVATRKQ